MSDFGVLTASLLVQGKLPGWNLIAPYLAPGKPSDHQPWGEQICSSNAPGPQVTPATFHHRPEFSRKIGLVTTHPTRPNSQSQQYAQRVAALRIGRLYTRLPSDSFQPLWQRATYQPTNQDWIDLLTREANAIAHGQGIQRMTVILGDALAQGFPNEQLSRDRFWLNQGLAGDTTEKVLQRLALLDRTNPDAIHLMVGITDVRQGIANRVILRNLREILHRLRAAHPQTQLYIHSILPTRLANIPASRIRRLNYNISILAQQEGVHFVNLQPAFSDENGNLQRQLTVDGVHLSLRGYRTWQAAATPIL